MKAYSMDLRERVLAALQEGTLRQHQIAAKYDIMLRTVENWARQWRETASIAPKAQQHGPARTLAACQPLVRELVQAQPDSTLDELCARVASDTGVVASPSMMCRELQLLHLPQKKRASTTPNAKPHASKRCAPPIRPSRRQRCAPFSKS